jgi:hypothetical protein
MRNTGGGVCWWLMAKQKTPAERLAELQAQVKAAKDEIKTAERKRFEVVGEAVVSLLETDADFKAAVLPKLRGAIKNPRDRAAIETLLV